MYYRKYKIGDKVEYFYDETVLIGVITDIKANISSPYVAYKIDYNTTSFFQSIEVEQEMERNCRNNRFNRKYFGCYIIKKIAQPHGGEIQEEIVKF